MVQEQQRTISSLNKTVRDQQTEINAQHEQIAQLRIMVIANQQSTSANKDSIHGIRQDLNSCEDASLNTKLENTAHKGVVQTLQERVVQTEKKPTSALQDKVRILTK